MKKPLKIIAVVVIVVAVVAGFGIWWFFKDDAPPKPSIKTAEQQVENGPSKNTDVDGNWVLDTKSGSFDFESATGSFAGFRIQEELQGVGSTDAVGRTGTLSGSLTIEGTKVTKAAVDVDLTSITTDRSQRDRRVQSALNTSQHPTATFTLTSPIDLGESARTEAAVSVKANGSLTLNGVTKPVVFALDAKLVSDKIVVTGDADITFSDFEVEVPSSPVVLSVKDSGAIELQLFFVRS